MLAELLTGSEVDFFSNEEVVPAIGHHLRAPRLLPGGGRLIKTHEPYRGAYHRAIYLVRDVRDVAISVQKLRAVEGFGEDSLDDFLVRFVEGRIAGYGSWQAHVTSWLDAVDAGSQILMVRYEDLIDETDAVLGQMARFLTIAVDETRIREIVDNNRPAGMRKRKTPYSDERMAVTVGEGGYDRWRTRYSEAQLALMNPTIDVMRRAGYHIDGQTSKPQSGSRED
jgi:hypothetical protein